MTRRKERKKWRRAADKAPSWLRRGVISKWNKQDQQQHNNRKLGTFGAASPVRIIVKDGI